MTGAFIRFRASKKRCIASYCSDAYKLELACIHAHQLDDRLDHVESRARRFWLMGPKIEKWACRSFSSGAADSLVSDVLAH